MSRKRGKGASTRGGRREGAGRPPTSVTARETVTWRLAIRLLTRIVQRAEGEKVTVTGWVEQALLDALRQR